MQRFHSARRSPTSGSLVRSALLAAVLTALAVSLSDVGASPAGAGADHTAPSIPTKLRVVTAGQSWLTLEWDASTDDVGVVGYKTFVGRQPRPFKTLLPEITLDELVCGQTYVIEVRAYDKRNNDSLPAQALVSTAPCLDTQAPSSPTGLRQVASGPTTATLAWNASADNVAVAGYEVSRGGVPVGTTSDLGYAFAGLTCGASHLVGVRARDVAGNQSAWASFYVATAACGDTSPPSAPSGLVQTDRTATSISLAWVASTDNVGVARYDVFTGSTKVGSTAGVTYTASNLACATSYAVGLEAVDGAGNRSARTTVTMTTAACAKTSPPPNDTQPPSTPTNLTLTAASTSTLTLTWGASTDNVAVATYGVFRSGTFLEKITGTTHVFQGLACGTAYQLGVEAYDQSGNHSARASVTASTSPCSATGLDTTPPTAPKNPVLLERTSTSATIVWGASSDNVAVAGYGAYVDGVFEGSTLATNYTFAELPCGTLATFGFDAYDAAGNRSTRATVTVATTSCGDTKPPTPPSKLAVSNRTQTGMTLSWTASTDDTGVAGYDVFANGKKVATVTGTSHVLGGLVCGTSHQLGVEAFDASGNRSTRETVIGETLQCTSVTAALYVSAAGSDGNTCAQAAPCRSLNRAYQLAALGTTVYVAGGDYPQQVIVDEPAKEAVTGDAPDVTFVPSPGQTVRVAGLRLGSSVSDGRGPDHITVKGITGMPGTDLFIGGDDASDITVDGYSARSFLVNGAQDVTITRGNFGPGQAPESPNSKIDRNVANRNISITGNVIHDYTFGPACLGYGGSYDCHGEGLFVLGGENIRVERNRFHSNWTYSVFVQWSGKSYPQFSLTICNNWFGQTSDGRGKTRDTALTFGSSSLANVNVCHNSFAAGQRLVDENSGAFSNVNAWGNIFGTAASCIPGVNYSYNVWTSGGCAATDRVSATLPYVNPSGGADQDYHLKTGTAATDLVTATGGRFDVPVDIDSQARPMGLGRDAGADESS